MLDKERKKENFENKSFLVINDEILQSEKIEDSLSHDEGETSKSDFSNDMVASELNARFDSVQADIEKIVEDIMVMYSKIFFEKEVNEKDLRTSLLSKLTIILEETIIELKQPGLDDDVSSKIIKEFNRKMDDEIAVRRVVLDDFRQMFITMNEEYKKIYMEAMMSYDMEAVLMYQAYGKKNKVIDSRGRNYNDEFEKYDAEKIESMIQKLKARYEYDLDMVKKKVMKEVVPTEKDSNFFGNHLQNTLDNYMERIVSSKEEMRSRLEPFVQKLEHLLDYQINFEKKFEHILRGEFHREIDVRLKEKYDEILSTAQNISLAISESFQSVEKFIAPKKIEEMLLLDAMDVISLSTLTDEDCAMALKKLENINANVVLTGKIINQLPCEEVARLDINEIPIIEKMKDIRGKDLLNSPEILDQIKDIIKVQFPDGDDAVFENECNNNPNFRLTLTLANGNVLSFFSKEQRSENIYYLDWFIANPDAPIKGLGEATLRLGLDSDAEQNTSYYGVAKPHVKSFQILVENLGFVGFAGSTRDGEYKHHYARMRRFPSDREYMSKNLNDSNEKSLSSTLEKMCKQEGKIQNLIFEGASLRATKVVFHGQTYHDDIRAEDPDGWIMRELDNQNNKGYVLTRFIPVDSNNATQTYYAIFENDSASDAFKDELTGVVSPQESQIKKSKKGLM